MSDLVLLLLTMDSQDGADRALDLAKQLDREGWIELMNYTLFKKDEQGHVEIRRIDDQILENASRAAVGVTGGVIGALGGPKAGAVAGAAAGALIGYGFARHMECPEHEQFLQNIPESIERNCSALALLIEERYAERLEERLQKLGQTVYRALNRAERSNQLRAYLRRSYHRIQYLDAEIKKQSAKATEALGVEKDKLENGVAADRAELQIIREKLVDHIEEMSSDLYAETREMNARLGTAPRDAKSQIAAGIDRCQRELNGLSDDLERLIEDRIEAFKEEEHTTTMKAASASGEINDAVKIHLLSVESQLRKERIDLGRSVEQRLLLTKQWLAILHTRSTFEKPGVRNVRRDAIKKAQHASAAVKAHARAIQREDEFEWKKVRQDLNNIWKELADLFDRGNL